MKSKRLRNLTDKIAFCAKTFNKLHLMPISILLFKLKGKIVLDYIRQNYGNFITDYKPVILAVKKEFEKSPIWVCWLQGEENAPVLVKKCISSIRNHSNGHPVIVLSDSNISNFVDIPDYIIRKVNNGTLSRTSYSDIVRSALLASYGGMWIDATFFITQDLPETYFEYSLFSAAKQIEPKDRRNVCISRYRWTTSFIGSKNPNHLLFCFVRDFFFEYIKTHSECIDYLLFDYIIYICYINFDSVKKDLDAIPDNNLDFGWLFHVMNKNFDSEKCKQMFNGKTIAYKLSWKIKWKRKFKNKKTFYGAFLDGELNNE